MMADAKRKLTIEILSDAKGVKKGVDEAESAVGGLGGKVAKIGGAIAGAFAVGKVAEFAGDTISSASDLNETVSKTQVIFGDAADDILAFGDDAAKSMGQSKKSALDAAAQFALFGKAAGLSGNDLTLFAKMNTQLASDMASFSNTSPEEAIEAIGAALRGEAEPIRKYGVLLDDATLKAAAMEIGIYDGSGALTQQQKVLAAQAAIFNQTSASQGDFARTSEGLANKQRIMSAEMENAKAKIGTALLPAMIAITGFITEKVIPAVAKLGDWFKEHVLPVLKTLADFIFQKVVPALHAIFDFLMDHKEIIIGVGVAILASMVPAMAAWAISTWAVVTAWIALNAPVIALGVVIAAFVAGVILAVKLIIDHWTEIVDFFKELPGKVLDFLKGLPDLLLDLGKKLLGGLLTGIEWFAENVLKKFYIDLPLMILGWIVDIGSWLFDLGKKLLGGLLDGIVWLATTGLKAYLIDIPLKILEWIGKAELWLLDKGKDILKGLLVGIGNGVFDVTDFFIKLPGKVLGWLGDGASILWDWGKALIEGIWAGVKAGWNWFAGKWNSGVGTWSFSIPDWVPLLGGKGFNMPDMPTLKAMGGPVAAGQPYIVGERGPELFMPGASGAIVPNGKFGIGGGTVNNITINLSDMDGSKLIAVIKQYTQQNGTAWMAA